MESKADSTKTLTITVPFSSFETATMVHDVLSVDKELKGNSLKKTIKVLEDKLVVEFYSTDLKLLRVASNSFLKNCLLVVKTVQLFEKK